MSTIPTPRRRVSLGPVSMIAVWVLIVASAAVAGATGWFAVTQVMRRKD